MKMSGINHHPFDLTLAEYAAGKLDEGRALVVATHLSTCPRCREVARSFERMWTVAMEDSEIAPLAADALQRAFQAVALERSEGASRALQDSPRPQWRTPLSAYRLGPWRRIGHRIHWRHVEVSQQVGTRVFMLRAAPGTKIPAHYHLGLEWTCVLQGAFSHKLGRYGTGDFDEADEDVEHNPIVEAGDECICLVALQGRIKFKGWLAQVLQSFVRI
jgi:putative transcriptional regulator